MDGNSIGTGLTNNSLLYLARELAANGIASVRYDKRGIGKSSAAGTKEEELRFDHYIDDASAWADKFAGDTRFSKVIIAGHSEGSLIGMVAAKRSKAVKGYVSISGCGSPAYEILEKQLQSQPAQIQKESAEICKELREGRTVAQVPFYLAALYRQSVQPYLISWFAYNPALEIAKLDIPVLILQGDKDIQVGVEEAEKLHAAHPSSSLYIIKEMNHVLKHCDTMQQMAQLATYSKPELPIKPELVSHIVEFVKE
jgi:alpha-beta hydrolase superfamily lysophospholipase